MMKRIALLMLTLPTLALAQNSDDNTEFEESVSNFGYVSGAAYQCAEQSAKAGIEKGALKAYSGLSRLFGTDLAFLYAAAFGAATQMPVDQAKCGDYRKQFSDALNKNTSQ